MRSIGLSLALTLMGAMALTGSSRCVGAPLSPIELSQQDLARQSWKAANERKGLELLLDSSPDAWGYVRLSDLLYGEGNLKESLTAARKAVLIDPRCWGGHNNVCVVSARVSKAAMGEQSAMALTELLPGSPMGYFALARIRYQSNRLDEARALIAKVLAIDSNHSQAKKLKERVYAKLGKVPSTISVPTGSMIHTPALHSVQTAESVEDGIQAFATDRYPDDTEMQEYIAGQQRDAYAYMSSASDAESKAFAVRKYPGDYSMQQHIYDEQVSAKRFMSSVRDVEVRGIAIRKYPEDYSMQQYVYNEQLSAKEYMLRVPAGAAKSEALARYPGEYAMQKYVYEKESR